MRSIAFDSVCNNLFGMYVLFALFSVLRGKIVKPEPLLGTAHPSAFTINTLCIIYMQTTKTVKPRHCNAQA